MLRSHDSRAHNRSGASIDRGGGALSTISESQAWAILQRHARDEIAPLRLRELCSDSDRVAALVAVHNSTTANDSGIGTSSSNIIIHRSLIVDLSRQLLTEATMNHLFNLSTIVGLKRFIRQVAWGLNTNPEQPVRQAHNNNSTLDTDPSSPALQSPRLHSPIGTTFSQDTLDSLAPHAAFSNGASVPSMHMALRVPAGQGHVMYNSQTGSNILTGVHETWQRVENLSQAIRSGQLQSANSKSVLRDVLVIGQGVAVAAMHFIYTALLQDENAAMANRVGVSGIGHNGAKSSSRFPDSGNRLRLGNLTGALQSQIALSTSASTTSTLTGRRIKFITSVDPSMIASVVSDLDPVSTLVISIALTGNEETSLATALVKQWLIQGIVPRPNKNVRDSQSADLVLTRHMILVTGNARIAASIPKPECVYLIPEHACCEPLTTFTVATLLPLSIVFGWSIVQDLLAGAHDLDGHFVESNLRHNLPVLLALTDIWNCSILERPSRAVMPFTEALRGFPSFVAAVEAQSCSNGSLHSGSNSTADEAKRRGSSSSVVVDGSLFGALDRALFESESGIHTELVMTVDTQVEFNASKVFNHSKDVHSAQDALMCSFFAQADELAFGNAAEENRSASSPYSVTSPQSPKESSAASRQERSGNRPSSFVMCSKIDAFACGQLIALSEHRAIVKAHILGYDPFAVREVGATLRRDRTDAIRDALAELFSSAHEGASEDANDDDDDKEERRMILSTKTLLEHYANMMRSARN
jgi:glucose-6-phosphate isomerase